MDPIHDINYVLYVVKIIIYYSVCLYKNNDLKY